MKLLKSYLFIGFVTGLIIVLIPLIMNHLSLAKTILGYIGVGLLLMGALYSGSMVSGDRMRANLFLWFVLFYLKV